MDANNLEDLIDCYKEQEPLPSVEAEARMWKGIMARTAPVAAAVVATTAAVSTAQGATVAAKGAVGSKLALVLGLSTLLGGGVVAGVLVNSDAGPDAEPPTAIVNRAAISTAGEELDAPVVLEMPVKSADSPPVGRSRRVLSDIEDERIAEPDGEFEVPAEPDPEPKAKPKRAKRAAVVAPASDLAEESKLLREAQQGLDSGRTVQAQQSLHLHRTRYPQGALTDLRQVLEISLACAKGNEKHATSLTKRFERAHPDSPYLARARRACSEH
jgi:hypothetical protein